MTAAIKSLTLHLKSLFNNALNTDFDVLTNTLKHVDFIVLNVLNCNFNISNV